MAALALRQLTPVYIPRGAVTPRETFEPLRRGFVQGDALGKHEVALADAVAQRALVEPGSARERIYAFQESIGRELMEGTSTPVDFPLHHLFPPGLYIRTCFLPARTKLVGKIHKHRHGNILSCGHVRVFTESGGVEDLQGPMQMISEPGTKRAVLAITDAVWTTIHLNPKDTRDLAELERDIIAGTYAEYEEFLKGQSWPG